MKYLVLLTSLLFATTTYAEWVPYIGESNYTRYFFKKDNYKTFFSGTEMIYLTDYKMPEKITSDRRDSDGERIEEAYSSIRSVHEIDCKKKSQRITSVKYYSGQMGNGSLITKTDEKSKWFKLDSFAERIACN
jgi:hypothetical protein